MSAAAEHKLPDDYFLQLALKIAAAGRPVFPLVPGGKTPCIREWPILATTDPEAITARWREWDPGLEVWRLRDYNVGIRMGERADGSFETAVDVDVKNGAKGRESLAAMQEKHGNDWTETETTATPSGGVHMIYRSATPLGTSANKLGPGIDTRGVGGFIVAPGSIVDGKFYAPRGGVVRDAPAWLADAIGKPSVKTRADGNVVAILDTQLANDRGTQYLHDVAPLAVEGAGGDATTYRVAARLKDLALSELSALELMADHWNDRCSPPWDFEMLAVKVGNAYAYGLNDAGSEDPTAAFDPVEDPPEAADDFPVEGKGDALFYRWARHMEPDLNAQMLVDDWIGLGRLSILYGQSNAGKTFVVMSLCYCISRGSPWNGCKTVKGVVVYVAAEGGSSVSARIKALRLFHGDDDFPMAVVPCSVDLLRTSGDTAELIALINAAAAEVGGPAVLAVIDTVSRAMAGGNENGPEDMTAFVRNLDRIRIGTGAHVMGVHHSGKDEARGARGHSSLRAATDTELEVVDNQIVQRKQRDMPLGRPIDFTLTSVHLGNRSDGRPVTSAVAEVGKRTPDMPEVRPAVTPTERMALDALAEAILFDGETVDGVASASFNAWVYNFNERLKVGEENVSHPSPASPTHVPAKAKDLLRRHRTNLRDKGLVQKVTGDQWFISGEAED